MLMFNHMLLLLPLLLPIQIPCSHHSRPSAMLMRAYRRLTIRVRPPAAESRLHDPPWQVFTRPRKCPEAHASGPTGLFAVCVLLAPGSTWNYRPEDGRAALCVTYP